MTSKYAPLESHLRDSGRVHVPMTFSEVEHVIGAPLPPAAFKHRALWSNNPRQLVENGRLVFRKAPPVASVPDAGGGSPAAERSGSFADIFGALKDTVTISPGTNLTDPINEDWNAAR